MGFFSDSVKAELLGHQIAVTGRSSMSGGVSGGNIREHKLYIDGSMVDSISNVISSSKKKCVIAWED